jgi:UDP-N-acetylmuramate-alanine ligase
METQTKLIAEFNDIKTQLVAIDATYATIKNVGFDHSKQLDAVRHIHEQTIHFEQRLARFYSVDYPYAKELKRQIAMLGNFQVYYNEHFVTGETLEGTKLSIINLIDGTIKELTNFGEPSTEDQKFG